RKHPDNADYQIGLARLLYWMHDNDRALALLDKAIEASPRNVDARTLKGDVLAAAGDPVRARAAYVDAQSLSPGNPEIGKKISRLVLPLKFRVDTGYIYDHYGNARGREFSAYGQVGYLINASDNVWFRE